MQGQECQQVTVYYSSCKHIYSKTQEQIPFWHVEPVLPGIHKDGHIQVMSSQAAWQLQGVIQPGPHLSSPQSVRKNRNVVTL